MYLRVSSRPSTFNMATSKYKKGGNNMTLEEMQEELIKLQEEQKTLKANNESLTKELENKTKREKDLEELNQKLFLRVTTKVEDPKKETVIPSYIDEDIYKLLDKKDLEILQELEEEE